VDAKMAGAVAAQRVLESYGFTAYAVDRLDWDSSLLLLILAGFGLLFFGWLH
jgi:hypothetical protein